MRFDAQEELPQSGGDGVALALAQRLEKVLVGGDYRFEGILREALALLGEPDEHSASVRGVGPPLYEPGPLEPVQARRHGPGSDQRRPGELTGLGALIVATPAKGVQDVEIAEAQPKRLKRSGDRPFEVEGANKQPPDDLERARVHPRVALGPGLDDAVYRVGGHAERSLA
jgi:hypothetical protein